MQGHASNYTIMTASAGSPPVTIENGNPIIIYGMTFSTVGSGSGTIELLEGDGTSMGHTINISSFERTVTIDVTWLADKGLQVDPSSSVTGIIFHSNAGA